MDKLNIGIDLGATKMVALVVDKAGNTLSRAKTKVSDKRGIEDVGVQLFNVALKALGKLSMNIDNVSGIGIAVPSAVDHARNGRIICAPNLGWRDEPGKDIFEKIFKKQIFLGNDVNCGMLAEYRFGAAYGARTAIGFFVGTGLGGGIVIDGKLHIGKNGVGGELGHTIVRYNGRKCGCGNKGCIEAYCSKTAFSAMFDKIINKQGKPSCLPDFMGNDFSKLKSSVLAKAYRCGDKVVRKVLNKGALLLGAASASMLAALGADCVVYGGGVMEALGSELMEYIHRGTRDHLFGLTPADLNLKLSVLGDDAVALGAALLPVEKIQA